MEPVPTVMRNAVVCHNCGKTIESFHRHDFVRCACPDDDLAVWVDGGHAYHRRMWGEKCFFSEIVEEFVPEPPYTLEHSDVVLVQVHSRYRCVNDAKCCIHNKTEHSKRSWVQHWDPRKGMQRISPTTGRKYKDPDAP